MHLDGKVDGDVCARADEEAGEVQVACEGKAAEV